MFAEIGLILIVAAWVIQFREMKVGNSTEIDLKFVFAYSIGAFILAMDAVISGAVFSGFLNLVTTVLALAAGALTLKR